MGVTAIGAALPRTGFAAGAQSLLLRARTGSLALRPGQPETAIGSLDGPGPVLRFKRGSELEIAWQNELPGPVAINWHGLDGAAGAEPLTVQAPLPAGAKAGFKASLRHAGTVFADVRLLAEGSRALALVVEEDEAPIVDRDEVFLIEDFRLGTDGAPVAPGTDPSGAAAVYTVNGQVKPAIAVHSNQRLRLRVINGCQRHVVAVKIGGFEVRVMAMDGQPAEPFPARNSALVLAPGGRADAFIDAIATPGSASEILLHDGSEAHPVARLVVGGEPPARPTPLPPAPALPSDGLPAQLDLGNAQRFELVLGGPAWTPPPQFAISAPPAFRIKQRRVIVLALTNRASVATTFHLHGHHFRLLDRLDDGWKPYWLDTLAIEPGQTQRIAFAAEHAGRWLLESTATDWAAPRLVRWYAVE